MCTSSFIFPPPFTRRSLTYTAIVYLCATVGNIPYEGSENDLMPLMSSVGQVVSLKLMVDHDQGGSTDILSVSNFCPQKGSPPFDRLTVCSALRLANPCTNSITNTDQPRTICAPPPSRLSTLLSTLLLFRYILFFSSARLIWYVM